MALRDYARLVRQQWITLVVAVLIGLLVAAAYVIFAPRSYVARTTVYVSTTHSAGEGTTSVYEGMLSSQLRIMTYTELLTGTRLATETVDGLRLGIPPEDLMGKITVTSAPDSVLLTTAVTDESPARAAQIANFHVGRFIQLVAQLEQPADPNQPPVVTASVVEPATPPLHPTSPAPLLDLGLGFLAGLVGGFIAALVRDARRTSPTPAAGRGGVEDGHREPTDQAFPPTEELASDLDRTPGARTNGR